MAEIQEPKRHDPPPAPVDGFLRESLDNADPGRHYCFLDPNNANQIQQYGADGYVREEVRKGGPRLKFYRGGADGSEINYRGMVLYSCPIDAFLNREDRRRNSRADAVDKQILQPGGVDALRGSRGLAVQNQSAAE